MTRRYNDGPGCRPYYSPAETGPGRGDEVCVCVYEGGRLARFDPRCRVHYPRRVAA